MESLLYEEPWQRPSEADRAIELAKTADGVRLVHSYLKTDTSGDSGHRRSLGSAEEAEKAINHAGDVIETGLEEAQDVGK